MAARRMSSDAPRSLSNLFSPKQGDLCQRCHQRVYPVEKLGPVNEVIFHRQCFRCAQCSNNLSLKTYFTNSVDYNDKEVYCLNHVPKASHVGLDANAMGIRGALRAPRARDIASGPGDAPRIHPDAMHIAHPVMAQDQLRRRYKQTCSRHHFPAFVVVKKDDIYRAQEELERQQREEEDRLMKVFMSEREQQEERMKKEVDQEWEIHLKELTSKFEQDKNVKRSTKSDKSSSHLPHTEHRELEMEKEELKNFMTIKMQKKKEIMTMRLQQKEQEETANLVAKHSKQMLDLLKTKQDEYRNQLKQELDSDQNGDASGALEEAVMAMTLASTDLPSPHPPACRKRDLYYDPSVFKEVDEEVFKVAEKDHTTFTDLVKDLTAHCISDLEKARAIFRWITVKDLNVMNLDEAAGIDTPMGLLRGIKYGTETYHTLFMRLCSYAGLACVEIKGHSKSVGYEPGMKIKEETFQNTWNAVLIDRDWWPVQCNWGARHLVLNKDVQEKSPRSKKQDKIRYQYDEHYFLTDPDEFIQEFWAQEPNWQLLEQPVTLDEFEAMPFVRSVFFHYGLEFDRDLVAMLSTDNKGGAEVKIRVPHEFSQDIVFHYQLRFADRERRNDTEYRGAKLERFVFHSLQDDNALFSVHVPTQGEFFLEIFANRINDSNKIGDDPNATMMPFRLKCACKFKIICKDLVGKMHPLPNCASGEWGPSKGLRHFGLRASAHTSGVIAVDNETEVRFRLPRALHFLCKLRMNGVDEHVLERYVSQQVHDNTLVIRVKPPQTGQYGLDIYARPEDASDNHTLAHACKYLLNVTRVDHPVELPVTRVDSSSKLQRDKYGPSPWFNEMGLKTLSHIEPKIEKSEGSPLTVEIGHPEPMKFSYHLIREPDEDQRDKVSMKENGRKVKFHLSLHKPGNYLLALYARRKKDPDMLNVYNYVIKYYPSNGDSSSEPKKRGSKNLFKK